VGLVVSGLPLIVSSGVGASSTRPIHITWIDEGRTLVAVGSGADDRIWGTRIEGGSPGFNVNATSVTFDDGLLAGCSWDQDFGLVWCTTLDGGPIDSLGIVGGDGADDLRPAIAIDESPGVPVVADGGPGNDSMIATGADVPVVFRGGSGNDVVEGGPRGDTLRGGPGDDVIQGWGGADQLYGEAGNDDLTGDGFGEATGIWPDRIDGGSGIDTAGTYLGSEADDWTTDIETTPKVKVTLDGKANDGRRKERDNLVGVERVGWIGGGTLIGDDRNNSLIALISDSRVKIDGRGGRDQIEGGRSSDTLRGGPGNDDIVGNWGNDRIVGGPGRDTIRGDNSEIGAFGNDLIDVRDGEVDQVDCGVGRDTVIADRRDIVSTNCEVVRRS
jgi:Ca2+-binding RTX toxin-like protein